MNQLVRLVVTAALAAGVLVPLAGAAPDLGAGPAVKKSPVIGIKAKGFGRILARRDRQALYYWNVEKVAGGKVRCTGSCAKAWPPLLVKSRKAVPRRVRGIKGVFGVVRRPDGKLQVTYRRLPLYTYAHERPGQVLCDDVNGWFVVRVS